MNIHRLVGRPAISFRRQPVTIAVVRRLPPRVDPGRWGHPSDANVQRHGAWEMAVKAVRTPRRCG